MKADHVPIEAASHKERGLYSASHLQKIRNGHQDGLDGHGMGRWEPLERLIQISQVAHFKCSEYYHELRSKPRSAPIDTLDRFIAR